MDDYFSNINNNEEVTNYLWKNFSIYGKPEKIKVCAMSTSKDKIPMIKNETLKFDIQSTFYQTTNFKGTFISDNGATIRLLRRRFNLFDKGIDEIIGRVYGVEHIYKINDELAVKIEKNVSKDQASSKLAEFINRLICICNVLY